MCGHDWCSVRISKEIVEFVSGKDEAYAWDHAKVSAALTSEQRKILKKRSVLDASEIHRLANKTQSVMEADPGSKAACHSDSTDPSKASLLQIEAMERGVRPPPA
jgi:phosphomethylpyrimidine synthase